MPSLLCPGGSQEIASPFRSIHVFYQVARLQSVSAAAQHLGVTPSAVSQQVRVLEEQVGTSLITKVGRKVRLTEAGERYFELISDDVEHILHATDQMRGAVKTALLTVRATPTVSTKWLMPRLRGFLDANLDLDLRLDGSNEPTDFNRENVDIEIRHGVGRWSGLHVQPLTEERFVPVCAPGLADAGSMRAAELREHRLIHSVKAQVQWPEWFERVGLERDGAWRRLYFDRSHMAVDAAVAGMGIALESNLMMERELRARTLIMPVQDAPVMRISTQWLVCPFSNLRRRRVRRFVDWILEAAAEWHRQSETTI